LKLPGLERLSPRLVQKLPVVGYVGHCASSVTIDARIPEVQHTATNFFNSPVC